MRLIATAKWLLVSEIRRLSVILEIFNEFRLKKLTKLNGFFSKLYGFQISLNRCGMSLEWGFLNAVLTLGSTELLIVLAICAIVRSALSAMLVKSC